MARRAAESSAALLSLTPRPATRIPDSTDSDPVVQAPAKAAPLEITKSTLVPAVGIFKSVTKAAASPRAPADQPTGAKALKPTKGQAKGQESPGAKVPPPMETRGAKRARAGGLRGVAGSGESGAVCGSSSPALKPGS
jgi:hypothetical protein